MPDYLLDHFLDHLCAPFIISTLLACAVVHGSAFAQSTASGVSQQASQSDSKTPGSGTASVQVSGGGYLGVYLGDVNSERAKELGLKEVRGAVVGRVEEGSPAAKVELRENDVILTFNAERVQNRAQFHRLLIGSKPGSKVLLGISRKGVDQSLEVVLGQGRSAEMDERRRLFSEINAMLANADDIRKQAQEAEQRGDDGKARELFEQEKLIRQDAEIRRAHIESQLREGKIVELPSSRRPGYNLNVNRYQIGVSVTPLTGQLAGFFNAAKTGVLITEVRAGELGEQAGLKAGDCIISVDGAAVKSASDLNRLVDQKSSGELEFVIVRDRAEQTIRIKLDQK
ncbi:MAG: PDZ domain-containing protein [Blastocatellales bacterium]